MLDCSIWFSAPSFWMGGGLESRCVGRVCGINVFLSRHVSGTYAHHQEHQVLSCSIWLSAPNFWMGGGLESRCVGRVCGAPRTRPSSCTVVTKSGNFNILKPSGSVQACNGTDLPFYLDDKAPGQPCLSRKSYPHRNCKHHHEQ